MLGFSPLSQGPIGTSGAASGNVTVTIDVQNVQAIGQTQSNDFLVRIPIVIPMPLPTPTPVSLFAIS